MPSDAKKREQQRKKDAAKARQVGKKTGNKLEEKDQDKVSVTTNGSSINGTNGSDDLSTEETLCMKLEADAKLNAEARSCTGSLAVHPKSRDVKIDNFSITFHGSEMLQDAMLELNCGRRYGLLGLNGSGKSTLLSVLGNREVPIPDHIDIFHLTREMPASDKSALQCVMEVDEERVRLEKLAEELVGSEDDDAQDQLMDIYERLDDMSADTAEARAAEILHGLGFDKDMQVRSIFHYAVKGQHSLSGSNSPNINKSTLTPNSKSVATPTRRSSRRLSNSSIQKTPDSDDVSEVSSITSSVSRKSASALVAQRLLEGAAGVEVRRSSRKSLLSPKSSNPDPQLKTTGLASRRTLMPSIEEETAGASKRNTAEDGPSPAKRGRSRKSSASSAAIRFLSPLPTEEIEQACRRKTQSKRASSIDLTVTAPSRRTTFKVNRKRPSSSSEK